MTSLPLIRPSSTLKVKEKRRSRFTRSTSGRKLQKAADALPLSLCDNELFIVTVTIGTQPFQLVVDTASTDLWVMNTDCLFCVETPNRYDVTSATLLFDNDEDNYYESVNGGNVVSRLCSLFARI